MRFLTADEARSRCGDIIPFVGYARAFVSHDEYVEFAADEANPALVHEFAAQVGGAKVRTSVASA